MKKHVFALCAFLALLFALPTSALADDSVYTVDELGLSLSVPSDYVTITRQTEEDDPALAIYGFSRAEALDVLSASNTYLNAMDEIGTSEISLLQTDNSNLFSDFNLLNELQLSVIQDKMLTLYESFGLTVSSLETYQHEQAKFIVVHLSVPNESGTSHTIQYCTVYNSREIMLNFYSYAGETTAEDDALLRRVVDSIVFDTPPQMRETAAPTAAFSFVSPKTQVSFTVPANWAQRPSDASSKIDAKFFYTQEDVFSISYYSLDLWDSVPESELVGYTRADVNNSMIYPSLEDLADDMGVPSTQVSMRTYGDVEYFQIESSQVYSDYGIELTLDYTQLITVENGYGHYFMYTAVNKDHFDDFDALMKSVTYPVREGAPSAISAFGSAFFSEATASLLLSLLVSIVIYSLPIVIYRYAIRKKPFKPLIAVAVTIFYAVFALIFMAMITKNPGVDLLVFLCSCVNYLVLTMGRTATQAAAPPPSPDTPPIDAQLASAPQADPQAPPAAPSPAKGISFPLLVIGAVLLLLQTLSVLGCLKFGTAPWHMADFLSAPTFIYDFTTLIGFFIVGIIGAVFVVASLPKRRGVVALWLVGFALLCVALMAIL